MSNKKLITGQKVSRELYERSRHLRKEMTSAEKKLWQCLRAGRLEGFHFRRQQVIDRFIVDFYCHSADLVVEVDGDIHSAQLDYDQERDQYLTALGLKVLRFTNSDINNDIDGVLERILEYCQNVVKKHLPPTPP